MEKTTLGVSVPLMSAAVCVAALAGGFTPTILLVAFILLRESNEWLKKNAVKVLAVSMFFSLLVQAVNLIPTAIGILTTTASIVFLNIDIYWMANIFNQVTSVLNLLCDIFLIIMAFESLKQRTVSVPVVDGLIEKYM